MKIYETDSPVFSTGVSILETTDTDHADNFNASTKQLYENTLVVKKQIDEVQNTCAKGSGIEFSVKDGILTVTYDDGIEEDTTKGSE
ncbi:MAG: hypothetical protein HFJ09_05395 [Lachnospiraceae bacterium]|nr:hypothetical protein [Lachnospiraceae bacterium]